MNLVVVNATDIASGVTAIPAPSSHRTNRAVFVRTVHARTIAPQLYKALPRLRNWEEDVSLWTEGNPSTGSAPLRDWTLDQRRRNPNWTRLEQSTHKPTFLVQTILKEVYEYLSDDLFRQTYTQFLSGGLNKLYTAIRQERKA